MVNYSSLDSSCTVHSHSGQSPEVQTCLLILLSRWSLPGLLSKSGERIDHAAHKYQHKVDSRS